MVKISLNRERWRSSGNVPSESLRYLVLPFWCNLDNIQSTNENFLFSMKDLVRPDCYLILK